MKERERWGGGEIGLDAECVPVLLWKEVSRPVSVLFATKSNLLPPATPSVEHQPLPPFIAAGLQTVKVQSDAVPLHSALRLDCTKLRPHKITDVSPPSFRFVVLA